MATPHKPGAGELLYACAEHMGLNPVWVRQGGLFAITVGGQEKYVHLSRSSLNSHVSVSLATDKHLTRLILQRHALPNIPFAKVATENEAAAFLQEHGKIIAKPHSGFGSRDVHIIDSSAQLSQLDISKYILEQYIAGREMRYLVLNGKVIGVHQSDYGASVDEHRDLLRISYPEQDWDPELMAAAVRIARILDLNFAAVDFLVDVRGRWYVLEVNARPGFKWFHAPSSGPIVQVAQLFMEAFVESESMSNSKARPLTPDTVALVRYN